MLIESRNWLKTRCFDRDSKDYIPGSQWMLMYIPFLIYCKILIILATNQSSVIFFHKWMNVVSFLDVISNLIPAFNDPQRIHQDVFIQKYNLTDFLIVKHFYIMRWLYPIVTCYVLFRDVNR